MSGKKPAKTSNTKRLQLEEICTRFENEWQKGSDGQLEKVLGTVDEPLKVEVATELVAVELELRSEIGETPECSEYLKRLPDYSSGVRRGFELWNAERCNNVYGDNSLPDRIGDYRIIGKLGEGGMGVVYEAIQESLDRRVAIKSLGTHPIHVPRSARRFRREARAVAMLHHTNIINIYGSGVHDGIPYFAMQLVEGYSIKQIIDEFRDCEKSDQGLQRPFSFEKVARIGLQITDALEYAHQQGVLHRDIKPSNLLLDDQGTAWVSDFGLAKVKNNSDATFSGDVIGTLRYVPPEAATGNWTELGDVYSLGVSLYEMLTLEPAYPETDRVELMNRISRGDNPVSLRRLAPGVPRDLETIVNKAISRDVSTRYQSAADLGSELRRFVDGVPITARPTSSTERLIKWSRRRPVIAALTTLIFGLFAIGLPLLTTLWLRTEFALDSVEAERMRAEGAKLEAEVARKVSEIARLEAEASEYGSAMQLAHSYLQDDNVTEASRLLNRWHPGNGAQSRKRLLDRRGWEWSYLNKQLDQSVMTLQGDLDYVWHVAVSPDDSMISTVHASESVQGDKQNSSEVIVWDSKTGKRLIQLPQIYYQIYCTAFSPDNSKLAVLGVDLETGDDRRGGIFVWDLESNSLVNSRDLIGKLEDLKSVMLHNDGRPGVTYSSDGKYLLVEPAEIFDANSLKLVKSFPALQGIFLRDQTILLRDKDSIEVRDLDEASKVRIDTGESQIVCLESAGNKISICFRDRVRIYHAEDLSPIQDIEIAELNWGAISPDSRFVVAADRDGRLHVRGLGHIELNRTLLGHETTITHGSFSKNGDWLVTCSVDGKTKIWDLNFECDHGVYNCYMSHAVLGDFAFASDDSKNKIHFAGRQRLNRKFNCGTIDFDEAQPVFRHIPTTFKANWPRTDMAFSANGKYFCAPIQLPGGDNVESTGFDQCGEIGIWKSENWQHIASVDVGLDEITSVAWRPDCRQLAVAGRASTALVRVFDVDLESAKIEVSREFEANCEVVTAMCFHDQSLAIASKDRVAIYKPGDGLAEAEVDKLEPAHVFIDAGQIHFVDFSPCGKQLAVAVKDLAEFRVYDLTTDTLRIEHSAPRDVCCIRYSPDGKRLALSGYDSLVYLCDAETGYRCISLAGSEISPGSFSINSKVVFSADGQRIATNNWKGEIRIWDASGKTNASTRKVQE